MKRDGLIMEFFKILEEVKQVRGGLADLYNGAYRKVSIARAVDGAVAVQSAAFALSNTPDVEVGHKNIMGVEVPTIKDTRAVRGVEERGYGIIGTSIRIDEAARSYEELVEHIIRASEVETALRKLLVEIEKTKRRVNALEYRVIPELENAAAFIELRLEELERENTFRLKRIKAKSSTV